MQRNSQVANDVLHRIRLLNVLSTFLSLISLPFVLLTGMGVAGGGVRARVFDVVLNFLLLACPFVLVLGLTLSVLRLRKLRRNGEMEDVDMLRSVMKLSAAGPAFFLALACYFYVLFPFLH